MNIPDDILDAAQQVIGIEEGTEDGDREGGRLIGVSPENYYELLLKAAFLARWVVAEARKE